MIIINTTFHIEKDIESKFCEWIRNTYIPSALGSELLSSPCFSRIMIEVQEECSSFAVSFKTVSIETAVDWHDGAGAELRHDLRRRFGDKALFFSTYMEELPM